MHPSLAHVEAVANVSLGISASGVLQLVSGFWWDIGHLGEDG